MELYVRKDLRRVSADSCPNCARWSKGGQACAIATCLACGSPQCHGNGSARGSCSVCLIGVLPGWSGCDRPCGYKGCQKRGIAFAPRMGRVCAEHALRARQGTRVQTVNGRAVRVPCTVAQYVFDRTEARGQAWRLVSFAEGAKIHGT